MSGPHTWHFRPDDTWFFRESRPHGAAGAAELESRFPPPPRTVAGAARTFMGDRAGVDWHAFGQQDGAAHRMNGLDLIEEIGHGADLGKFQLTGPWVACGDEPLFPAPAFLLAKGEGKDRELARLRLGGAVKTDLGRVQLPEIPGGAGYKPLEDAWLTRRGLERVLAGGLPETSDIYDKGNIYAEEPRLGIARDNHTRTTGDGMLYQTRHLRLKEGMGAVAGIAGVDERLQPGRGRVRFGGEGRQAAVNVTSGEVALPKPPQEPSQAQGVLLVLLTDADLGEHWLPADFRAEKEGEVDVWRGEIAGVGLTVHGAALGKARREGGWDLAAHKPRPARSLTPAGSAWYCVPDGPVEEAVAALHGARIGADTGLGRGHLAAGVWPKSEFPTASA